MNIEQALGICNRITYKPTWKLESNSHRDLQTLQLRLSFTAPCAVTGKVEIQVAAHHVFNPYELEMMDERDLCNRLLSIFRRAEEHEMREFFKLDGVAIYDPHKE